MIGISLIVLMHFYEYHCQEARQAMPLKQSKQRVGSDWAGIRTLGVGRKKLTLAGLTAYYISYAQRMGLPRKFPASTLVQLEKSDQILAEIDKCMSNIRIRVRSVEDEMSTKKEKECVLSSAAT